VPLVQFCSLAFADYAVYSDMYLLFNVQLRYAGFFTLFYTNNVFIYLIIISFAAMSLGLLRYPRDQSVSRGRRASQSLVMRHSGRANRSQKEGRQTFVGSLSSAAHRVSRRFSFSGALDDIGIPEESDGESENRNNNQKDRSRHKDQDRDRDSDDEYGALW
jgi:hypothetical protein